MRRQLTVTFAFTCLLVLAGCTSTPTPNIDSAYEGKWNASEDAAYYVEGDHHTTILRVNSTEIEVWVQGGLGGDQPVRFTDARFRYPNGTVVNASSVEVGASRTTVTVPMRRGRLAFAAPTSPGRLSRPLPVDGNVRVVLPNGTDARNIFLGGITPGSYEVVSEDPLTLKWTDLDKGTVIEVRYYNERDPVLLIALLSALVAAAIAVLLYYQRVFSELARDRSGLEDEL